MCQLCLEAKMLKKITYQAAVLLLILPGVAMANIHHGAKELFE